MTPVWSSALIALAIAKLVATSPQTPRQPFHEPLPPKEERLEGPASVYANLSPLDCRARLKKVDPDGKMFKRYGPTNGVANPLRVVGPIGGVSFQVPSPRTLYGVLDCRQALLWIDLAPVLVEHQVQSIRVDNFYRNRARIRGGKKSQHAYGLAADVVSVTLEDGRTIDVEEDFLGRIGEPVCGPNALIHPKKSSTPAQVDEAIRMRNLVCELARRGAFHHMLTPNYNTAHRNHLHLDIKRDNTWLSIN